MPYFFGRISSKTSRSDPLQTLIHVPMEESFKCHPHLLILDLPDFCPVCEHAAQIEKVTEAPQLFPRNAELLNQQAQMVFRCPRDSCSALFLGVFSWDSSTTITNPPGYGSGVTIRGGKVYGWKRKLYPSSETKYETTAELKRVSASFFNIASQASRAESAGLDEIAGMGYRKALEFLIKDYCISELPSEKEVIEKKFLGNVISDHVSNQNIKDCAQRAVWLGNDETHYKRKWTHHDVNDLKTLIQLTESWITNELLTKKYKTELVKGKEPVN